MEQLRDEVREEIRELVREELISECASQGLVDGIFLLDIEQTRESLRRADDLLRRMERAIITAREKGAGLVVPTLAVASLAWSQFGDVACAASDCVS